MLHDLLRFRFNSREFRVRTRRALASLVFLFLFTVCAFAEGDFFVGDVARVLSGNRVILKGGTVIQYAGIDVFSLQDENPALRKFAAQAQALNQSLVGKGKVRFEFLDTEHGEASSIRIAYAYAGGSLINGKLLQAGLAILTKGYSPDEKFYDYFRSLQQVAIQKKVGVWQILAKS